MRVAFDTSVTDLDNGGISRYVRELQAALTRHADGIDLVPVSMFDEWPWTRRLERHLKVIVHDQRWIGPGQVTAGQRVEAELIHGTDFKVAPVTEPMTAVTIHDDTPWDDPPTASFYNRINLRRSLRRAAPLVGGALVSTDTTAAAVLRHLPELEGRLFVTPFGVDHTAYRPVPPHLVDQVRKRHGILGPYVLVVGAYGPRKNFPRMVEALSRVRDQAQGLSLVLTGRPPAGLRAPFPVIGTGYLGDDELSALYSGAEFLFYASLNEGFGFPVVEAMACGCPVLTSRGTVLEELAGSAAVVVDPRDVEAMTAACELLLGDDGKRKQLGLAGQARAGLFDWEQTAAATARAWLAMR